MSEQSLDPEVERRANILLLLGAISGIGYALLLWLSWKFDGKDVTNADRPTILMLTLFAIEFVCYWGALWLAVRLPPTKWLIRGILAAACLFRAILLPSVPMHEIDLYRYIWDGAVLAEGISPYKYSPQQILEATVAPAGANAEQLQRLVELQAGSESLGASLREIHYGQYPSPYPIVSQAVFAASAMITPDSSSKHVRMVIMKTLLVLMDLATLLVVIKLLLEVGLHPGLSIAYGWCPLMMKEVANGGHLDSIAIFFTTLAVWLLVRSARAVSPPNWSGVMLAGAVLALAIGAKIYPVVLVPLFAAVWFRRLGLQSAIAGGVCTTLVTAALLSPFLGDKDPVPQTADTGQLNEPAPAADSGVEASDGLRTFIEQWEMNDLIFMVVLENLREHDNIDEQYRPWFKFTSDQWANSVVTRWIGVTEWLSGEGQQGEGQEQLEPTYSELRAASFSLTRLLTGGIFALLACWWAWRGAAQDDPQVWCRMAMLTLAWFWLTCPTQNPWYWCWMLPLLPFARYRTWYAVAAVTMLYYLRFWLDGHYEEPSVLGTPYNGVYFFYFIIAWVEFLPCLLGLAIEWCYGRFASNTSNTAE